MHFSTNTRAADATMNTVPIFSRWFGSWQLSLGRRVLSTQELTEKYDQAAANWTRTLIKIGAGDAYASMFSDVFQGYRPQVNGAPVVLDCGVGTGCLSLALVRALDRAASIDGIDISPAMLERAAEAFANHGIAAALRQCDIRELPYPDNTFDIVISAHLIEHLPDPAQAISEMVRVLRPGGLMVICTTTKSLLGSYIQLKWRTHRVASGQANVWLQDAGMQDIQIRPLGQSGPPRSMSIACIAEKPVANAHTRSGEINE